MFVCVCILLMCAYPVAILFACKCTCKDSVSYTVELLCGCVSLTQDGHYQNPPIWQWRCYQSWQHHYRTTKERYMYSYCQAQSGTLCFRAGISPNDFLAQIVEFYTKISHISPSPLSKCFSLLVFYCVKLFCEWSTFSTFSLSFVCTLVVGWEGLKIINILCEVFCYQAVCKLVTELI